MISRSCNISTSSSFFLLGARGTGKSTLLKQSEFLRNALKIDLLVPDEESRYSLNPELLLEQCRHLEPGSWVIIDEVQKLPKLLDLVHKCIEEQRIKFALTGSSARKLKRGGANLLAGRAFVYHLYPFTSRELGDSFDLEFALSWGSLPGMTKFSEALDRKRFLNAYVNTYIKEEIQVEQLVRNLDPFRLFLQVAGQMSGQTINYSNIARDTGVDNKTVQTYFQILVDTHIGLLLNPYERSVRKVQKKSPKFYFFDTGVERVLARTIATPLLPQTTNFGNSFESWFINECIRESSYREADFRFSYLRTKDDAEIDLIIERPGRNMALVEIKSTDAVDDRHLRGLRHFAKDFPEADLYCVSRDPKKRQSERVAILHWADALGELFERCG